MRPVLVVLAVLAQFTLGAFEHDQLFEIRFIENVKNESCLVTYNGAATHAGRLTADVRVESYPQVFPCDENTGDELPESNVVTIFATTSKLAQEKLKSLCTAVTVAPPAKAIKDLEVVKIVDSGPPLNRIDVVLMGDGYQAQARTKFFSDMDRMVKDMWGSVTFKSYLPLFNVWAIYQPSVDDGIGTNGRVLNTPYGLYRQGTELRGVYTARPQNARDACRETGPGGCDFPSLIGNSPYYGGLGGEFTISTSSETSGTMVLRHEMGHTFGQVGEEYDGGQVYSGANSSPNIAGLKWRHWIQGTPRIENAQLRLQAYPWYNLAQGPSTHTFTSDGAYARAFLRFTASGCETNQSFAVQLDGVNLDWFTCGTLDRCFYSYDLPPFTAGQHTLRFVQLSTPTTPNIRQLCSLTLHEYKGPNEFVWDNENVSLYPTWSINNRITYRPNNEKCLMRNMTSEHFCQACYENLWLQFFAKMSAIDDVTVTPEIPLIRVTLKPVPLAQFRDGGALPGETYTLAWFKNGVEQTTLADQYSFALTPDQARGSWNARLIFRTPEVRADPRNLLTFNRAFTVN